MDFNLSILIKSLKQYIGLQVLKLSSKQLGEYTAVGGSIEDSEGYIYVLGIGKETPDDDVLVHELVHVCQHFVAHKQGYNTPRRLKFLFSGNNGNKEGLDLLEELEIMTLISTINLKEHINHHYPQNKQLIELEAYWIQEMYNIHPDKVIELLNIVLDYV